MGCLRLLPIAGLALSVSLASSVAHADPGPSKASIERLAERAEVSQRDAKQVFAAIFDANPGKGVIAEALRSGHQVYIRGFGTFGVERRAGGSATDPKSGKMINIPPLTVPRFVPDRPLLVRMNKKGADLGEIPEMKRAKRVMDSEAVARRVAQTTGLALDRVRRVMGIIFSTKPGAGIIATELDGGRKLEIPGFGSFILDARVKRQGRNPRTGAAITIPASKTVSFKAAPKFTDSL